MITFKKFSLCMIYHSYSVVSRNGDKTEYKCPQLMSVTEVKPTERQLDLAV